MRKVMRWRYYCDHCKRAGGSAAHIAKHERGCTNNPSRVCGLCAKSGNGISQPVSLLVAALGIGDDAGMKALRDLCDDCPACILAALRQTKALDYLPLESDAPAWQKFHFKTALAEFWADLNDAQAERESHCE
jgi:hypothetical protein